MISLREVFFLEELNIPILGGVIIDARYLRKCFINRDCKNEKSIEILISHNENNNNNILFKTMNVDKHKLCEKITWNE